MTYIKQIIDAVNVVTGKCGPVLLFGENIDTGSRIAGLARGLEVNSAGRILNVGNCELTHCGIGLGMMLDRGNAVLFMKQLDFLLLGIDQIVNTFNFIRAYRSLDDLGSFTIFLIVCDQGYQGPQSSMNSVGDLASLANVDTFCLNAAADAAKVVSDKFIFAGFRSICVSQRLFGAPALEIPAEWQSPDLSIFRYRSGQEVTIACYNFALRSGVVAADHLAKSGVGSDLFHVNFLPGADMTAIRQSCARTGRLIIIDDSKTVTKFGDALVADLCARRINVEILQMVRRGCSHRHYGVTDDQFTVDHDAISNFVRKSSRSSITAG
jgi:pyruvate/2-oxoglutarate/acetoin dehydrogenase E1 component